MTIPPNLPPPNVARWTPQRKAAVVFAVRNGSITLKQVLQRYQLTKEEFLAWESAVKRHGIPGLRTTWLQLYRRPDERASLGRAGRNR